MSSPPPRRAYRSDLRTEQARATRRAVVEAAHRLYVERGYQGTTIDAVADAAGVSRKTVFTAVGGKAALLKLAFDWALAGDDEPVPLAERPEVAEMLAERDPARLAHLWARFVTTIAARIGTLDQVLQVAARTEPEIAVLQAESEANRRGGAMGFVSNLAAIGGLRDGMTVQQAADIAGVLMDPMPHLRLVEGAGWTPEEYAGWVESVVLATLVRG